MGPRVTSPPQDRTSRLVESLARVLDAQSYTLAVAESCTGGGLGAAITDLPGASTFFKGGVVAYSNEVKERLLGVAPAVIEEHGAVSELTVKAMAEGARVLLAASVGIAVTGIAGPSGAAPGKPVGLVYVAVATPAGTVVRRDVWPGARAQVRAASIRAAIELALDTMEGESA